MQSNWIEEILFHGPLAGPSIYPPPQFAPFCEQVLNAWNSDYFELLNMEVILCREISSSDSGSFYEVSTVSYAIYLTDRLKLPRVTCFDGPPTGVSRMEFFYPNANDLTNWVPILHPSNPPTSPRVHFQADE